MTQSRGRILVCCVLAMIGISNFQYAWTLFTGPLVARLSSSLAEVQAAFAIYIIGETWLVPFAGLLADRYGPRPVIIAGGMAAGLGWVGIGTIHTLPALYVFSAVCGTGCGAVYGSSVGCVVKWFPDRRGLCAGLVAAGSSGGTALTILPLAYTLDHSGPMATLVIWGLLQGALVVAAALAVSAPPHGWRPPGAPEVTASTAEGLTPREVLGKGSFWLMYVMMALMSFTGLVANAQLAPFAQAYHVNDVVLAFGMSPLVLAIQIDRLTNGISRPFWGWASDRIGRAQAMYVAFGLQTLTIVLWIGLIDHPIWFIVMSGLAFFSWGEILSLFPAAVADVYGPRHASTNYGMLYTAKGVASIAAGPLAALFWERDGSWLPVLWTMAACSLVDALLARFVLRKVVERAGSVPFPEG